MSKKIALITGGTGGIGTAICRHLLETGYEVIAADKIDEKEATQWKEKQKAEGYSINFVKVDVSDYKSCQKMAEKVLKQWERIDVLVNNAGITEDSQLYKMTQEKWEKVIQTNLNSIFNVTRHIIENMIKNEYGRIINISSVNAQKGQYGQTNYSAAKAGIHGVTKSLAQEVAKKGITVNTVSPGYVATRMTADMRSDVLEKIIAQIPVGRLAKPEEIAYMVGFLADEKNSYITGGNFSVNGGFYMY